MTIIGMDQPPHDARSELQRAKLAALAEFAAGAGHELNNPLGSIVGCVQLLLEGESDPERRQWLATIGAQAYRIRDMIGDVMLFARPPAPRLAIVDLGVVAREAATAVTNDRSTAARLMFDITEPVPVRADATQLRVVVSSLVRNAFEALDRAGGCIDVCCRPRSDDNPCATLTVTDDGPGWSAMELEHAFDPFFSGRQAGRGLGFGLSKCWRIIEQHGGQIHIETLPEHGSRVVVHWPAADDPTCENSQAVVETPPSDPG